MKPTNLLFIFSDQHNRAMTGCYGHALDVTPINKSGFERILARRDGQLSFTTFFNPATDA